MQANSERYDPSAYDIPFSRQVWKGKLFTFMFKLLI